MRWKGIIFLVILVAGIAVISIFFIDKWIEAGIEKTGSAIVGAKVEIDNLNFSLFKLSFTWNRLQVTNPNNTMKNIIETGRVAFKMNTPALFRKRYVIEEMTLADFRMGTPRQHDGALPKKEEPPKQDEDGKPGVIDKAKEKLSQEIDMLPVMNLDLDNIKRKLNLDSLIVMADLKVINRLDSVKVDVTATSEKWQAVYKNFHPDEDLKQIKADVGDINPKAIKDIPTLVSTVDKVKSARGKIQSLSDDVSRKRDTIRDDFNRVSAYTKQVDDWFSDDYQRILKKAQLPDLSVKNIGKILFGGTLVNQMQQYFDYLKLIRKYMPKKSDKPKKEDPPRMAGQIILFPDWHGYPSFLIKSIHVSGQTGISMEQPGMKLSGDVTGITSQPWIYGKPTIVDLKGVRENKPSGGVVAVLNHITETSNDSFHIELKNFSLNNFPIHKSSYLPSKVNTGFADFDSKVRFKGNDLLAEINVQAQSLQFDFPQTQTSNKFTEIVQDVINSLDVLNLKTTVVGKGDDLDFTMDSNLDNLVSARLKALGSKALQDAQQKIKDRLNTIRDQKYAEVNTLYNEKRNELEGKIDTYKKQVEEEKNKIESKIKEIQDEIDSRKKAEEEKLKQKAKSTVDDLLKKKP